MGNPIPFFAEKYKVIAIDLRCHGKMGRVKGNYSINKFASDVAQLISELTG